MLDTRYWILDAGYWILDGLCKRKALIQDLVSRI